MGWKRVSLYSGVALTLIRWPWYINIVRPAVPSIPRPSPIFWPPVKLVEVEEAKPLLDTFWVMDLPVVAVRIPNDLNLDNIYMIILG